LPTYRGPGGLWSDPKLAALTDAEALVTNRIEATDMFWSFHTAIQGVAPTAAHCGERMRPCAVLFGEMIPVEAERTAKHALRDCDLFVAIGTSGSVAPASSFVSWAQLNGARRILLDLEIFEGARALFSECHAGPADELVPALFV
jgi:NAD-dependent SIR2 family protein deacetylase